MLSVRKTLRVTLPAVALVLGATVFVNVPVQAASCAHPTAMVSFLQKIGFAKVQPCEVIVLEPQNGTGEICANVGHHCNDGSGPGKCQSVMDATTGSFSCQCVK